MTAEPHGTYTHEKKQVPCVQNNKLKVNNAI